MRPFNDLRVDPSTRNWNTLWVPTGEMAEWLIALDSKSSVPARVPGVQIPLSPPLWPPSRVARLALFRGRSATF
jgi:hypothetical protein